ncbi:conserved hypothetical protein [Gordonia bronchialis DSM 43247]|uniref:Sodium:proton antiporter n=1 Tax=Gordonia bronchialis (strain ATCC 25592 / DSM 43247 / BCRC 13721 / JCM 3198 / KCTC 3076 / NBRC 16047 / NCTC 10667) TaxID=526226 RepID=D0L4A8_GORB4|nr:DUF6328 family protein [Gordonia bronchialis]ACY20332.1 conserved hypothetical protein [Gordonia bronchialis DSM 43247]MCC3323105.1 DUF6328 family protein [Gordonia bronchialis]QGS25859.1 hypothetical protein FOB84_18750 [Gordonia bronchialis]UAK37741.1 DUF6328 family protein [Gordonia bronchialis]STQ63134.1 Uncharacterised protein [Gordonia bronchialis]
MGSNTSDAEWNREQRSETKTQRLDRNWASLLQELRVVQTGVQILTGFLLTLPFQDGFEDLGGSLRVVYLVTVTSAVSAAILLAAPVALHRALFRRHQLELIVTVAHRLSYIGLLLLGIALSGAMTVVFGATSGPVPAVVAGTVTGLLFGIFWLLLPLILRARTDPDPG